MITIAISTTLRLVATIVMTTPIATARVLHRWWCLGGKIARAAVVVGREGKRAREIDRERERERG